MIKQRTNLLFSLIFLFSSTVFGQTEEKSCTDCHASYIEYKTLHAPAEDDCENCHSSNGKKHPQENVKGFDLSDKMPDLCFMCHDEYSKKNIHPPAEEGECLMCHSPHGSNNEALLISAPQSALCFECHDTDITEKRVKHQPAADGNCASCHDPHQSDYSYMLKKEKPALCLDCHTSVQMETKLKNIHPPFDDDCANCHAPHSTDENNLLIEKLPVLCDNCHEIQSTLTDAKVVHKVVNDEKGCANCHSAHASNQRMFLKDEEKKLCLSCHSKTIKTETKSIANIGAFLKKGNYVHAVIEDDGCVICHAPHASNEHLLLNGTFPEGNYTNGKSENFELCFNCHDTELIETERSSTATNFRDGNVNLHYLHINGEKARNCNLCHNVHGATSEHLISSSIRFGEWDMPLLYKAEENGGSCNTGCHAEKKYVRQP